jgi:Na+-driven multidrug efflux pump
MSECHMAEVTPSRMAHIDTEVVTLVAHILPILALFQVPDFACAITSGILRARGKQVRTFIILRL